MCGGRGAHVVASLCTCMAPNENESAVSTKPSVRYHIKFTCRISQN